MFWVGCIGTERREALEGEHESMTKPLVQSLRAVVASTLEILNPGNQPGHPLGLKEQVVILLLTCFRLELDKYDMLDRAPGGHRESDTEEHSLNEQCDVAAMRDGTGKNIHGSWPPGRIGVIDTGVNNPSW